MLLLSNKFKIKLIILMMKKILSIIIIAMLSIQLQAQSINQHIIDPDLDKEILMGEINEEGLSDPIFVEDWQDRYDVYLPDRVVARKLKKIFKKNKDISIKVFMASWCGDSKQHLPDFVKLVHQTKLRDVRYYALNRQKEMDDLDFIDLYSFNIERVPTFIVYKGGQEIGRIVETPQVSLEKDLLDICQ